MKPIVFDFEEYAKVAKGCLSAFSENFYEITILINSITELLKNPEYKSSHDIQLLYHAIFSMRVLAKVACDQMKRDIESHSRKFSKIEIVNHKDVDIHNAKLEALYSWCNFWKVDLHEDINLARLK